MQGTKDGSTTTWVVRGSFIIKVGHCVIVKEPWRSVALPLIGNLVTIVIVNLVVPHIMPPKGNRIDGWVISRMIHQVGTGNWIFRKEQVSFLS